MKKIILTSLIFISLIFNVKSAGYVADIFLQWTANPTNQLVTKYLIYQAIQPNTNYVPVVTVVGTNYGKVRVMTPGTYNYKITAINTNGESLQSDFIVVSVLNPTNIFPSIPTNLGFKSYSITITGP